MQSKICTKCKVEKPVESFSTRTDRKPIQYQSYCKMCNAIAAREYRRKNPEKTKEAQKRYRDNNVKNHKRYEYKYGITIKDYNKMFMEQDGCCNICKTHQSKLSRKLCVDHCHSSGTVRGLLCDRCNHLLGHAKDNIVILKESINYLKKEVS